MTMVDAIFFYTPDGPYGNFSNFAKFGVAIDGVWWPTAEHYFQSQKFDDAAYREKIRRASSAKQAADLGRTRTLPLRLDWDVARVEVMRRVVTAKFETHPDLRALLLSTGERPLIESAPGDKFWGAGPDGTGENRLGRLLEELRARFRAEAVPQ
ncbi:NADAR family protein [Asticcacaulis sp. ZE23SCel15]|uniref:NADAR family protein n=1 Tax=Asticcacaulis sp. ZE23SCel15 TaxID=3059027 RepID=UPI00265E7F9D|nr:NADAR family protein [Asticcacaulis sp. ZE23SCel15]WKL59075.1 NADAR family protein [Asticcacaulis sp. ZE23SCel15]